MPRSYRRLLLATALVFISSGCGTIANITAPTTSPISGYRAFGPTVCEPFGGVQRSVAIGSAPLMAGVAGDPLAAVAVGVDAPLSLVGDILTLPIVYYRLRGNSEEERSGLPPTQPVFGPAEYEASGVPVHAPADRSDVK